MAQRKAQIKRKTKETDIELKLNLDGSGKSEINTPINFLNHMLENFSKHSRFDLTINAKGDTHVDCHHTIEDIAICLGQALDKALGDKCGIARMGHAIVPMDDSLAVAALDLSGRGYAIVNMVHRDYGTALDGQYIPFDEEDEKELMRLEKTEGEKSIFKKIRRIINLERKEEKSNDKTGDLKRSDLIHFLETFAREGKFNLNIKSEGTDDHHKTEACFKALAKAFYAATRIIHEDIPSTKGVV